MPISRGSVRNTLVVKPAVVAVQEIAGDGRDVEHVLDIAHHLPAVLVGEDQRQIDVGVAAQPVIGLSLKMRAQE